MRDSRGNRHSSPVTACDLLEPHGALTGLTIRAQGPQPTPPPGTPPVQPTDPTLPRPIREPPPPIPIPRPDPPPPPLGVVPL